MIANEQSDKRSNLTPDQIAKAKSKTKQVSNQYKIYKYYFIIAIISLIAVFFLPMLGTDPAAGFNFPTTVVGWIVYITTKILVAIINMLLFHCFMCQGKLNIKDNPFYIEACEILRKYGFYVDNHAPRSPDEWLNREYRTKGVSITITSVLSAVVLTQAILVFDWVSMLTYLATIVFGVIFGLFQQDAAETYWTEEFWYYAKMIEKQYSQGENNDDTIQQFGTPQS